MITGDRMPRQELFSAAEIGVVAGIPVKAVYKVIEQRLPASFVVRRKRQPLLTRRAAVCVLLDREMPKDVPADVRRQVYAQVKGSMRTRLVTSKRGILRYVVDVKSAADKLDAG